MAFFTSALNQAKASVSGAVDKAALSLSKREQQLTRAVPHPGHQVEYVDLTIQFIGASGLPQMDIGGLADPYFRASLDEDKLMYVSTVKEHTLAPVWNELWMVKNVPTTARLEVVVFDKDVGPSDDVIGRFNVTINPGAKEAVIESIFTKRAKGTFWLKIDWRNPTHGINACPPYSFDGPVRYSRYKSPTVGLLTWLNDERLYSTWKISIKGVPMYFGDTVQGWNKQYPAAQRIFGTGPESIALRSAIFSAHSILYARTTRNDFGIVETPDDALGLFRGTTRGQTRQAQLNSVPAPSSPMVSPGPSSPNQPLRVKPAIYTYVIADKDSSLRFSETGAAFLVDFASKHALHSNCAESVRYSGEFHLRPAIQGGWTAFHDDIPDSQVQWELVVDNNSGTYAPNKDDLWRVRCCLEYNLPGLRVSAFDREDPELKASVQACRDYALRFRGVAQQELQPHVQGNNKKTMSQMIQDGELRPPAETQVDEGAGGLH